MFLHYIIMRPSIAHVIHKLPPIRYSIKYMGLIHFFNKPSTRSAYIVEVLSILILLFF